MQPARRRPLWTWVKVVLCLFACDVLFFWLGLFWTVKPRFGEDLEGQNWDILYSLARRFEVEPSPPGAAFVLGSSVVRLGVDEPLINTQLQRDGLPVHAERIFSLGASCTDIALLARRAIPLRPWLMIYVAAARDFAKQGTENTPIIRMFYDSSVDLPLAAYQSVDGRVQTHLRRYWKLYRYRFFARRAVSTRAVPLLSALLRGTHAFAQTPVSAGGLPPEAWLRFHAMRVTPETFARWERWRQSRNFDDYLEWIRANGSQQILDLYKLQTLANYGPDLNPHWLALQWMLGSLQQAHIKVVIAYAPENPLFRDPRAKPYFDASLSQAWAKVFENQARLHGARFVDLRDLLEPEDFYDLIHPNLVGMGKLSARLATIIEEERSSWRSTGGH